MILCKNRFKVFKFVSANKLCEEFLTKEVLRVKQNNFPFYFYLKKSSRFLYVYKFITLKTFYYNNNNNNLNITNEKKKKLKRTVLFISVCIQT